MLPCVHDLVSLGVHFCIFFNHGLRIKGSPLFWKNASHRSIQVIKASKAITLHFLQDQLLL